MTGSIAPNRPGHHGTVVARTVGTVAISCNGYPLPFDPCSCQKHPAYFGDIILLEKY